VLVGLDGRVTVGRGFGLGFGFGAAFGFGLGLAGLERAGVGFATGAAA
jgi:hypothetical protein